MIKILFSILFLYSIQAYEKSDAFVVRAFPEYYKVLSPVKVKDKIGLIIENNSLDKIVGKLTSLNQGDIETISIKSQSTRSIEFNFSAKDTYYFIPLSPPFQKVRLQTGHKSYEVPSQRKD